MEILVLSDTHLQNAAGIPSAVLSAAQRADHILHAGDLSVAEVVAVLQRFAPTTVVHGNVEASECFDAFPQTIDAEVAGIRVGMVHDAGPSEGRHSRLTREFPSAQLIVYGHTHVPEISHLANGVVILNPGSSTQRRRQPKHTFAWVSVGGDGMVAFANLVELES